MLYLLFCLLASDLERYSLVFKRTDMHLWCDIILWCDINVGASRHTHRVVPELGCWVLNVEIKYANFDPLLALDSF